MTDFSREFLNIGIFYKVQLIKVDTEMVVKTPDSDLTNGQDPIGSGSLTQVACYVFA
jgi:hypothetical protein